VSSRPPRRGAPRAVPAEPEDAAAPVSWGRQTWVALVVMAALVAAVIGAGVLVQKTIEPSVPNALAGCATSAQIAPHEYLSAQPMCITGSQKLQATIKTTQGNVVIQLAPEVAPVTVNNFVVLAIHGYYNGLNFWKSEDWVVQGGDPRGDGRGGPGYNLPDETTATPWALGSVGMARVPGGAVNGSQFFIQKAAWPDPGPTAVYNRFGTVISGMDKVQLLTSNDTISSITIKVY
jgi:cyclophilin family peptidyl-prolyl cis-trans isomerase